MVSFLTSLSLKSTMRLDIYVFEHGLANSRTDAKRLVMEGAVSVNGIKVLKPSYDVADCDDVKVDNSEHRYVSRGGFKLEGAIESFCISVEGVLALDVGASSGGFTDCLLKKGASHVIAVDSGSGQMVSTLRVDERVTVIESYNARYMKPSDFEYSPNLIVMDVSFISATCIIPAIFDVAAKGADFICLVKPQFEVGRSGVGKGGIVKDERLRKAALEKVIEFSKSVGFEYKSSCLSPIKGGDGNIEYLVHFIARKE